jgi:hypothetical protein
MDAAHGSELLFGRHQALTVYAAIARLTKPEFTTGQLVALINTSTDVCSKELRRLCDLGLVEKTSRRGDYRRVDASRFWELVDHLESEWRQG